MDSSALDHRARLAGEGFFGDAAVVSEAFGALEEGAPLLISGPRGCGKTAMAGAIAAAMDARCVRLVCSPTLPPSAAAYRWDTSRQVEAVQAAMNVGRDPLMIELEITSERFLERGPLLEAIDDDASDRPVVLVVDGLEAASPGLRSLLADFLDDYSVEVPPLGRFIARQAPVTVLTCRNSIAPLDGIRERCRSVHVGYPNFDNERAAVRAAVPSTPPELAVFVCNLARRLRDMGLRRPPGVGETIALARSLVTIGRNRLDSHVLAMSLDTLVTHPADRAQLSPAGADRLLRPSLDKAG